MVPLRTTPNPRVRLQASKIQVVSSFTPEFIRNCKSCGRELQAGALACDSCHALVHSQQLDAISREAKALEAQGKLMEARNHWLMALPLLPKGSKQAEWICILSSR